MGVKGLYGYLKAYRHDLDQQQLIRPYRIGLDAMSLLYTYKATYSDLIAWLRDLKAAGHQLVMVLDGKTPAEKAEIVKERREVRAGAGAQATTLKSALTSPDTNLTEKERRVLEYSLARLEFQSWNVTKQVRQAFQEALKEVGVLYVKAAAEADDVLVDLVGAGKLDVVVSTDMDYLLSGAPRLWIPCRRGINTFEEIVLSDVLTGEDLDDTAFRDAAILCGVEPLRATKISVPAHTAFGWLRLYRAIEGVLARPQICQEYPALRALETSPTLLATTRVHFLPQTPWDARIRSDQMETARDFLTAL